MQHMLRPKLSNWISDMACNHFESDRPGLQDSWVIFIAIWFRCQQETVNFKMSGLHRALLLQSDVAPKAPPPPEAHFSGG
jgi:hypothetical protein